MLLHFDERKWKSAKSSANVVRTHNKTCIHRERGDTNGKNSKRTSDAD